VDFFNDTAFTPEPHASTLLGTDATAPYSLAWKATAGIAHIKARVEDAVHYDCYSNTLVLNIVGPGGWVANPEGDAHVRGGISAAQNFGSMATLMVRGNADAGNT